MKKLFVLLFLSASLLYSQQINLNTDVKNQLPVVNGGTNANTAAGAIANLGAVGWSTYSGTSIPSSTCSALVNNGYIAINASPTAYQCSNATGTYQWNALGGSGSVTGTGTAGHIPLWSGHTALGDSLADYGVTSPFTFTFPDSFTINANSNADGTDPGTIGLFSSDPYNVGNGIYIVASGSLSSANIREETESETCSSGGEGSVYPCEVGSIILDAGLADESTPSSVIVGAGNNITLSTYNGVLGDTSNINLQATGTSAGSGNVGISADGVTGSDGALNVTTTGPTAIYSSNLTLDASGNLSLQSLPSSTNPICANGISGALTTTGCVVGLGGTVTSVGLTMPGVIFNSTVPGSPVTGAGTLSPTLATQTANTVLAGPATGIAASPTFRTLVSADIPNNAANTSGNAATATYATSAGSATDSTKLPLAGGTLSGALNGTSALFSGILTINSTPTHSMHMGPLGTMIADWYFDTTTAATACASIGCVAGGGTITAVSVATANGFQGTSSGGPTPALSVNVDSSHVLPVNTGSATSYLNQAGTYSTPSVSGGTVTSFATPSASWPSWLVPTVTNPTSAPSLAVAASAIPNSALANTSTTVNGQTCTLGGTCTVTADPNASPLSSITPGAAISSGGSYSAPVCYTGFSCDSHSGLIVFVVGLTPTIGGAAFTLNFSVAKDRAAVCIYQDSQSNNHSVSQALPSSSTQSVAFASNQLTSGVTYTIYYLCN